MSGFAGAGNVPVRKRRKITPSFVAEFPLRVETVAERSLCVRFDAARQIYNAVLGESLRRLDRMRETKAYQAARRLPRTTDEHKKTRAAEFELLAAVFAFESGSLQRFAQACRDGCWIGDHLGSHDLQTTSLRAFRAAQQYAFGKRGQPKFKQYGTLESVEGKSNAAVITYRRDAKRDQPNHEVRWLGLVLPMLVDLRSAYESEVLSRRVKYVRIVRRQHGVPRKTACGHISASGYRWFAQLVCEGAPPARKVTRLGADHRGDGPKIVGLDVGPSRIAIVTDTWADELPLASTVLDTQARIRRIQRAMDRSRRATNPDNYHADQTVKKGPKKWLRSMGYVRLAAEKRNLERVKKAERKRSHGELSNIIVRAGTTAKAENISHKALQKRYGKSVGLRSPGSFMAAVVRKIEAQCGKFVPINMRNTRLSQYDHTTNDYVKKSLSLRVHVLRDGSGRVQRDVYSAFLGRYCDEDSLDASQAVAAWRGMGSFLLRTASSATQPASGAASQTVTVSVPQSHVRVRKRREHAVEAVVRKRRQRGRTRRGRCTDGGSNAGGARTHESSTDITSRIFGLEAGE